MKIVIKKRAEVAPAPPPDPIVKPKIDTSHKVLDGICEAACSKSPPSMVSWFLMASYVYYVHHHSMLSDELYDRLAKDLLARWGEIDHRHKHLITPDDLRAGTLYTLKEQDYPRITRGAAQHLIKGNWGVELPVNWGFNHG